MKIELAAHSGFCMGVKKAIVKTVKELNSSQDDIFVYGPLIHNPQTMNALSTRGLATIDTITDISGKIVAIRTHGIPVDELKIIRQGAQRVINLTCPRVAHVQAIIKKFSKKGYHTIIAGDDGHAEIKSLKSFALSGVSIVSSVDQLKDLSDDKKYVLVAQTTHDRSLFKKIVNAAEKKFSTVEIIDTICDSTRKRQDNVCESIQEGIDTLVVVGGKNSANTRRLADIGRKSNITTIHIEEESELSQDMFSTTKYVLVTAGASTPGWIINNVLETLYNIKYKKSNWFLNFGKKTLEFLMRTNIISALFAFWATLAQLVLYNNPYEIKIPLIALFYIFSMYTVNNIVELKFLKSSNSNKFRIYERFGKILLFVAVAATIASLYLSMSFSVATRVILFSSFVFGYIYFTYPVKKFLSSLPLSFFQKIYNSKLVTGLGWALICSAIPFIEYGNNLNILLFFSINIFFIITARQYLIDRIAYQGDFILGRDTLPIWLGPYKSEILIKIFAVLSVLMSIVVIFIYQNYLLLIFMAGYIYLYIIFEWITSKEYLIALKSEFLVDFCYLLFSGLLALFIYF